MLKVDTVVMQNRYEELGQLLQRLNEAAQEVNAVSQRLSWDVAVSKRVRQVLGQQNQHLSLLSDHAEQLRQVLLEAIRQYEKTERMNAGKENSGSGRGGKTSDGGGNGAFGGGDGGGGFRGEEKSRWKELVEQIEKWLGGLGSLTESDVLGLGGSIAGLIMALAKLGEMDDATLKEIMQLLTDATKEGMGVLDKIYKLLEEKMGKELGLSDKACIAGLVKSYLGVASAMEGLQGMNWVDKMRNSKELIESLGGMVSSLYSAIAKDPQGNIAVQFMETAFTSIAVTAVTMIGDVAYYMGDGNLTFEEWAKMATNGPTQGVTTWIKGVFWGAVDIDHKELLASYERNVGRVSAYIARITQGNTAKRIALTLPAGAAVFMGGTYETLRAYYEKVSSLFQDANPNQIPGVPFSSFLLKH